MVLRDSKLWFYLAFFIVLSVLIYLLSPILTPFVFGALLAYLGDPMIDRLEKLKMSRGAAVALVFAILLLIVTLMILLLVPLLQNQLDGLSARAPQYGEWLDQTSTQIGAYLGVNVDAVNFKELAKQYLPQAGNATKNVLKAISQSGSALLSGIVVVTLTPVVTFYLMRDWDDLVENVYELIPLSMRDTVSRLSKESDTMVSAFLRGQFLVMTGLGTIYAVGLSLVGLQFALLVGFIAGLMSFIPYLGTAVGVVLASILFVVQYQDWLELWKVGLVFIVGQTIEGYLLTPWLVGDRIGLHPVAVIFAILAGGQLFGFVGVLLALPISAVLAVLIRYSVERYKKSDIYNDTTLDGAEEETLS